MFLSYIDVSLPPYLSESNEKMSSGEDKTDKSSSNFIFRSASMKHTVPNTRFHSIRPNQNGSCERFAQGLCSVSHHYSSPVVMGDIFLKLSG